LDEAIDHYRAALNLNRDYTELLSIKQAAPIGLPAKVTTASSDVQSNPPPWLRHD